MENPETHKRRPLSDWFAAGTTVQRLAKVIDLIVSRRLGFVGHQKSADPPIWATSGLQNKIHKGPGKETLTRYNSKDPNVYPDTGESSCSTWQPILDDPALCKEAYFQARMTALLLFAENPSLTEPRNECNDPKHGLAEMAAWCKVNAGTPKPEDQEPLSVGSSETPGKDPWVVPWDPKNPDYMQSSDARVNLSGGKPSAPVLSKKMGVIPVHYMRKQGQGCRVHIGEYHAWARGQGYLNDSERNEIAEEYLADVAARGETAAAKQAKRRTR